MSGSASSTSRSAKNQSGRSSASNPQSATDQQAAAAESAKEAGLVYVSADDAGIARRRAGKAFTYWTARGKRVKDEATLARIKALVLPPAWNDVWICREPRGHLQATGIDARGRKQYRYHVEFRRVREEVKYGRMLEFAAALPKIRRRLRADLKLPGMPREKVLAAVVHLLETTQVRVGNDEYARKNKSFGLTTLRNKHARVIGSRVEFQFRGKSGVQHAVDLHDAKLAKIVRQCQELPGEELFTYLDDDGQPRDIGSADVNEYLQEITGADFTAKDFRTWAGTLLATQALQESAKADEDPSETTRKKQLVAAIDTVAAQLGNTRAVCRKCYIHPAVTETFLAGTFTQALSATAIRVKQVSRRGLKVRELAVINLVRGFTSASIAATAVKNAAA